MFEEIHGRKCIFNGQTEIVINCNYFSLYIFHHQQEIKECGHSKSDSESSDDESDKNDDLTQEKQGARLRDKRYTKGYIATKFRKVHWELGVTVTVSTHVLERL